MKKFLYLLIACIVEVIGMDATGAQFPPTHVRTVLMFMVIWLTVGTYARWTQREDDRKAGQRQPGAFRRGSDAGKASR